MSKRDLLLRHEISDKMKLAFLIGCLSLEMSQVINQLIKGSKLSFTQLNILEVVCHRPDGMTVNHIKDHLLSESPNISRSLNALMKSGYIEKVRLEDDQRKVNVIATQAGIDMCHTAGHALSRLDMTLNDEDVKSCLALLSRTYFHEAD